MTLTEVIAIWDASPALFAVMFAAGLYWVGKKYPETQIEMPAAITINSDLIAQNNALFKDMIASANQIETETQRQTTILAEVLIVARTQTEVMRGIQTEIIRNNRGGH